jgi:hypothetical protein
MTQDNQDDLVFVTREEIDACRVDLERGWNELLAEASGWPTISLDDV